MTKRTVTIPKVCQWYLNDFAPKKFYSSLSIEQVNSVYSNASVETSASYNSTASSNLNVTALPMHCLIAILPYLHGSLKSNLVKILSDSSVLFGNSNSGSGSISHIHVKYLNFDSRCHLIEQKPIPILNSQLPNGDYFMGSIPRIAQGASDETSNHVNNEVNRLSFKD